MITFITVEDVNSILGATWTDESKKAKSVLMANTWMNGLNLKLPCDKATHETIIPDDVKQAGAYAALSAANGGLYQQKTDSGVLLSKSVDADDVSVSKRSQNSLPTALHCLILTCSWLWPCLSHTV